MRYVIHVINFKGIVSALHIAALHGQAHLVDLLIQHGAVVNASDYLGYTPLHLACQKCYQNIVVRKILVT